MRARFWQAGNFIAIAPHAKGREGAGATDPGAVAGAVSGGPAGGMHHGTDVPGQFADEDLCVCPCRNSIGLRRARNCLAPLAQDYEADPLQTPCRRPGRGWLLPAIIAHNLSRELQPTVEQTVRPTSEQRAAR